MQDKELFQIALGIKSPWYIKDLELNIQEEQVTIYIDFERGSKFECPECNKLCSAYDTKEKVWRHLDFFHYKAYIHARVPRIKCDEHGIKTVNVPWSRSNTGFTLMFETLIIAMCREMPVSAVARIVRMNEDSVWRILKHYVDVARKDIDLSDLEVIGVDEFSVKRHDYITLFYDLDEARVIHIEPTKEKDVFKELRNYLGEEIANQVNFISMDMFPAYISGANEYFDAEIVYDRFHVVKQMNDVIDKVRRRESKENELLKNTRYLWLKNPDNLSEKERRKLNSIKDLDTKTAKAYQFKLALQRLWELSIDLVEEYLNKWCSWAARSRIEEIVKLGRTIKNHASGIIGAIKSGINNGVVEGLNNKIRTAFKRSYGFKSDEYRDTIIYLVAGKLSLPTRC